MSNSLTLAALQTAIAGTAAGLRSTTMLQPLEGKGGKIFPATFDTGNYAYERRRTENGAILDCVLIDSVQSQANRAELALLDAIERGEVTLPLIRVDFASANPDLLKDIEPITALQAPHRLADAILRDSMLPDGTRFSKSKYSDAWRRANLWNATAIYQICPTALVFGMWGSPEKPGGLGAKFERAYVSEMVAIDVVRPDRDVAKGDGPDKRKGFRIDPLGVRSKVPLVRDGDSFTLAADPNAKNAIKPSVLNHGNIIIDSPNTGVRCEYIEQVAVLSFGVLRKLRFPASGGARNAARDTAARTVLAAIGLCAAVLANERGTSLRSRCNLVATEPRQWELIPQPGDPAVTHRVNGAQAIGLLNDSIASAKAAGVTWMEQPIELQPTPELVALVRKSQEIQSVEGEAGEP